MKTLLIVLFCLVVFGPVQAQTEEHTLPYDGLTRSYDLYIPTTYAETPLPLVIALHASGGSAQSMAAMTGFNAIAEREGFLVLYPEGPYAYWDYGAGLSGWEDVPNVLNDPGYLRAVFDEVLAGYAVDLDRIYAVGFSNGARMAYRLGCELPELAAIAAVAATISDEVTTACLPEARPAVLYLHGTLDPVIPWYSKPLRIEDIIISHALSAPQTARFWAIHNGCDAEPGAREEMAVSTDGRVRIEREIFGNCTLGGEVAFYRVEGGGHRWNFMDGVDTGEMVWEFFEAHPHIAEENS